MVSTPNWQIIADSIHPMFNDNFKVALLHVDGCYDDDIPKRDIKTYSKYLASSGMIACHDYDFLQVNEAVNELIRDGENFSMFNVVEKTAFAVKI